MSLKNYLIRGGATHTTHDEQCISDEAFFEQYKFSENPKPRRMSEEELRDLYKPRTKLNKDQKLVKSVLDDCLSNSASKTLPREAFEKVKDLYEFRRKYRRYLRIKRLIPLSVVAPFTTNELSKMAYAVALGSKSVSLTLPGLIGYSLPAFFFFHMSSYYVVDKFKPMCHICKYALGAPFWIVNSLTDELLSSPEEAFFGQQVPIDVTTTGGIIPADLGDLEQLKKNIKEMQDWTKTY